MVLVGGGDPPNPLPHSPAALALFPYYAAFCVLIFVIFIFFAVRHLGRQLARRQKEEEDSESTSTEENAHDMEGYSFPPEFENSTTVHVAIWFGWPSEGQDIEPKKGLDVRDTLILLMLLLLDRSSVQIHVAVNQSEEQGDIRKRLCLRGEGSRSDFSDLVSSRVRFFEIPHFGIWIRDWGPIFVVQGEEENEGSLAIAGFDFNEWGYDLAKANQTTRLNARFGKCVARALQVPFVWAREIVSEGGDRSINGLGEAILLNESVELQRNPEKTNADIERSLQRSLGVTSFVWLSRGLVEDEMSRRGPFPLYKVNASLAQTWEDDTSPVVWVMGTGGHVDEFCRFVDRNTVMLSWISDDEVAESDLWLVEENSKRLRENFAILQKWPFHVVFLPCPEPVIARLTPDDGVYQYLQGLDIPGFPADGRPINYAVPVSYMNFLLSNDVVIVPQYFEEGMDERVRLKDDYAKKVLEGVFPGRKTIQEMNPLPLNYGGGGIHCVTQHQLQFA